MRSGTTLISNFLNSNRGFKVYRDFLHIGRLKDAVNANSLEEDLSDNQKKKAKRKHNEMAEKLPITDDSFFVDEFEHKKLKDYYFSSLQKMECKSREVVGHKTTQAWDVVEEALSAIPDLKVIYMVRDPRDVAVSAARKWPHEKRGQTDNVCKQWRKGVNEALRCRRRNQDRVLVLKFEDFLTNTEKALNDLSALLGVKVSVPERMMEYGKPWRDNSSFKKKTEQLLDSSAVGRWKTQRPWIGRKVESECGSIMHKMGYKVPGSVGKSAWMQAAVRRFPDWSTEKIECGKRLAKRIFSALSRRF